LPPISTLFPYTTLFRSKLVGFDVETDSQGRLLCLGIGVLDGPSGRPYVTVFSREAFLDLKSEIYWFLQANRLLAHNGKFDLQVLDRKSTRLNSSHVKIS